MIPLSPHLSTGYALANLLGLQYGRHIYAGTVDPVTVQERRAANRRARKARRLNRRK
ncbi:hypothetical protein [Rhodococcus opacus]|uniref:hypothetical protein n=1 Tax=Rhodococcus opacus TaxID=37919 RepID=UPI001C47D434|nr:hypothetical protein [Rhodococcus opacus]MBV6758386.1 hypothetical protein [Rhodococcus opacus]